MNIRLISGRSLTPALIEKWSAIRQSNPTLKSPFFSPFFTQILASSYGNIYVGMLEDNSEAKGFFPFCLNRFAIAKELPISDHHGIIIDRGINPNVQELLRGCNLRGWDFEHLTLEQVKPKEIRYFKKLNSPIIDISSGYRGYLTFMQRKKPKLMRNLERQSEKLASEFGSLRFEDNVQEESILETLFNWKEKKYLNGSKIDPRTKKALKNILSVQKSEFKGILSTLYAGKELIAIHMGMASSHVLHYWFPAYNERFSKYSPGMLLLFKMVESAANMRVKLVDLGIGGEEYKKRLANSSIPIAKGSYELFNWYTVQRYLYRAAISSIRKTPFLYFPIKRVYKMLKKRA